MQSLMISGPCDKATCEYASRCVVLQRGRSECICKTCDPTSDDDPVCGSDARTYPSYCHLQSAMCKMKKRITVHKMGSCGTKISSIVLVVELVLP